VRESLGRNGAQKSDLQASRRKEAGENGPKTFHWPKGTPGDEGESKVREIELQVVIRWGLGKKKES